jgi:hypothetical protein
VNRFPNPSLGRRQLLRNGGLALSIGAIASACGTGRAGGTDPGRLGVAEKVEAPQQPEINDVVLLRTAQSLEYTALAVYEAAGATGALSADETKLATRFVEDHTRHATLIGSLTTDRGGAEFPCANPFVMNRTVGPILAALEGTDDLHRDLLNIAHGFEAWAAASYQALVAALSDLSLRTEAMRIGGEENRHAAALASVINPAEIFSPALFGEPVDKDADGFPVPYAIPGVFGSLAGIELVVGARDAEGSRFSTQLQTPAQNSLVYESLSC